MSGHRAHRITRLEEAATARMVHGIAQRYALTDDETSELMRETQQALRRWRAGLPLTADGDAGDDYERSEGHAAL